MALVQSSQNASLDKLVLTAHCQRADGSLNFSSLTLSPHILNFEGYFHLASNSTLLDKGVPYPQGVQDLLGSSRNVTLAVSDDGKALLSAELRQKDGTWHKDTINLDRIVANRDGRLAFIDDKDQPPFSYEHYCHSCQNTLRPSHALRLLRYEVFRPFEETLRHIYNPQDLAKSAAQGCPLCTILHDSRRGGADDTQQSAPDLADTNVLSIQIKLKNHIYGRSGTVTLVGCDSKGNETCLCTLDIHKAPALGANELVSIDSDLNLTFSSSTSGGHCLEMARWWLADCESSHSECKPISRSSALPARVLCIGISVNDSSEPFVRVCSTKELPGLVRYLTLSHCWGSNHASMATLCSKTVRDFAERIPWLDLPPTFRDAINITHALCYQYLWIDSLCIIQDDQEDKQSEIKRMGAIYANSSLNIGAKGPDSRAGCFQVRDSHRFKPYVLFNDAGPSGRVFFLRDHCASDFLMHDRLFKRGWVVQERFMATRTLDLGGSDRQLTWECGRGCSTEFAPCLRPHAGSSFSANRKLWIDTLLSAPRQGAALDGWYRLLHFFCLQDLTFPEDRLPAFSAICQAFAERWGSTYCHGLWLDDVARGLLWISASKPGEKMTQVPSWSWASVQGRIELGGFMYPEATDHTYTATLRGHELGGKPLCIQTCVLPAVVSADDHLSIRGKRCSFRPDFQMPAKKAKAHCLLLSKRESQSGEKVFREQGIVVVRVSDSAQSVFKRIGYFTRGSEKTSYICRKFRSPVFSKKQLKTKEDVYLE